MALKITHPTNSAQFDLGKAVEFKGTANGDVIKVELLAEDTYKLGEFKVLNGIWSISSPFNRRGKRRIIAKGFNGSNKQVSSDEIDIFLVAGSIGATTYELGIDVSNHNGGSINWQHVKSTDISFAFVKATEGATFKDSTFSTNWQGIQKAGIMRGAYHFFRPLKSLEEQVNNFLDVVKNVLEPSDLPPALDLEHFPNNVKLEWEQIELDERIKRVKKWLNKVEKETGRKPIIYTSPSFWQEFMGDSQAFIDHPLWIANYVNPANDPGTKKPSVPANNWGGKGFTFWQHTEAGTVAGVSGKVDRNRFNGSFDQLVAFVKTGILTA